jgi:hypothetical protein
MSEEKGPASRPMSEDQAGESGGGTYPNPHSGKDKSGNFKGGQSDQSYYGHGRRQDGEVHGNSNAPSTERN